MKTYKCINCGYENIQDEISTCPNCGFHMYETPYNRSIKLKEEIIYFLKCFQINSIKLNDLDFYRYDSNNKLISKSEDDERFPSFNEIRNYVCSASKTEEFFERLNRSINQIEKYLDETYENRYKVSFSDLIKKQNEYDETYSEVLKLLNIDYSHIDVSLPEADLIYSESKNEDLYPIYKNLIDLLLELSKKVKKFIQFNNLYGSTYKDGNYKLFEYKKEDDSKTVLNKCINQIKMIIDTKYEVDIFSTGTEETKEMLKGLWSGVSVLRNLPILNINNKFIVENNEFDSFDTFIEYIKKYFEPLYININKVIDDPNFLSNLDEDKIFELYSDLMEYDYQGFMYKNIDNLLIPNKSEKELNKLIGLENVKLDIKKLKAYLLANKENNKLNINMVFYGNPGTGKTEVARLIAGILHENKILPSNKMIEVSRADLVAGYVGQTAIKTQTVFENALGGVLFIDEAYSLLNENSQNFDYGKECVDTLIKLMEDFRGEICVIFAGYKKPMDKLLESNPGFESRIQFKINFENYSRNELKQIALKMLKNNSYEASDEVIEKVLDIVELSRTKPNFANAREVRNVLDKLIMCQNLRVLDSKNKEIGLVDVNKYMQDEKIILTTKNENKVKSAEEKLDSLIGLNSIKKYILKIKAYALHNSNDSEFNLHMCFYGNPGTGKTEVARLISTILYDNKILPEAKFIETNANGLIGQFVGETGKKTHDLFISALGGVLFIDEAYTLASKGVDTYAKEALATLLKDMEDYRGKICVILAGYRNEMSELLQSNPGFKSRIQFELDFPDYNFDELLAIEKLMIQNKGYQINEDAAIKICEACEYYKDKANFANARTIRNIIDQVIMNQNLRAINDANDKLIKIDDVLEYIEENGIELNKTYNNNINIDIKQIESLSDNFNNNLDNSYIEQSVISISGSSGEGTGFIISPDGLCLTCAHVVENNNNLKARVIFETVNKQKLRTYFDLEVLKIDSLNDIALLKIKDSEMSFSYLPLAKKDYNYVLLNEFIMAGYPFGGEHYSEISFSKGSIASINYIENRKVVFADMFGKPGNSGSPVICNNKVIGIFWGGVSNNSTEIIKCFTPIEFIWNLFLN